MKKSYVATLLVGSLISLGCILHITGTAHASRATNPGECTTTDSAHGRFTHTANPPDDEHYFPYGFLCSTSARDNSNITVGGSTGAYDRGGSGDSNGDPKRILQGATFLFGGAGFDTNDKARSRPAGGSGGGDSSPNTVIWTTFDINTSGPTPYDGLVTDGTKVNCPGSSGDGQAAEPVIYNYQDNNNYLTGSHNASPIPYGGGAVGRETCQSQGKMVYWRIDGGASGNIGRNYKLKFDPSHTGTFVIRTNISVDYGNGLWPNPSTENIPSTSANDGNTLSRIAKQTNPVYYEIYNSPVRGRVSFSGCGTNQAYRVTGAEDRDHDGAGAFYRIRDGGTVIASGATDTSGNAGGRTNVAASHTYVLEVLDPDSVAWSVADTERTSASCVRPNTVPVMTASASCTAMHVEVGDQDNNGSIHVYGVAYKRSTAPGGAPDRSSGFSFSYDVPVTNRDTQSGGADIPWLALSGAVPDNNTGWVIDVGSLDPSPYDGSQANNSFAVRDTIYIDGPCYQATCSLDVQENVPGTPTNGVRGDQDFSTHGTITATGGTVRSYTFQQPGNALVFAYDAPMAPLPNEIGGKHLDLTSRQYWTSNHDVSIPDGTVDFNSTPPLNGAIGAHTMAYYPDYYGKFAIGPDCSTPVNVYNHFNITPRTSIDASVDEENPNPVGYSTGGTKDEGPNVTANKESWLTRQAGGTGPDVTVDGVHSPDTHTYGSADDSYSYTPSGIQAGDKYCSHVTISPAKGWVGPGNDIADGQSVTKDSGCVTTVNEPYVHIFGSDAQAGGGFGDTCTTTNGSIQTLQRKVGSAYSGSGAQLAALSVGPINGFSSALLRGSTPTPASGLSFANTTNIGGTGQGGNLGGGHCVPDYFSTKPTDAGTSTASSVSIPTTSGAVYINPAGGTLNISTSALSTVADSTNITMYVNGNVHISGGGIGYANTNWANIESIPSFQIIAKGNIYVDPSVKRLDGMYVAQPKDDGSAGSIYTCSNGAAPFGGYNLLSVCRNQLVVNGSFVAQHTYLQRTFGSLRNSIAGERLDYSSKSCTDSGNTSNGDCAAEIFNFSPEVYLQQPNSVPTGGPTTGVYDFVTSLSPVL